MRLAFKLIGLVLIAFTAISVLDGVLRMRREFTFFRGEVKRDIVLLGQFLPEMIADAWRVGGEEEVRRLTDEVNSIDPLVRIRWVWLDAAAGSREGPVVEGAHLIPSRPDSLVVIDANDLMGESRVFAYFPVPVETTRPGALEISESLSGLHQYTRRTAERIVLMTALFLLVGVLAVALISIRLLGPPLRMMVSRAHQIGAGELSGSVGLHRRDELGQLAIAMDEMSAELLNNREAIRREMDARIEVVEQLRHADRMRSVGRLASGIAHELGTPLNVISGRATLLARDDTVSNEVLAAAKTIKDQSERMTSIIRQLLGFVRRSPPRRIAEDLIELARHVTHLLEPLAAKKHVTMRVVPLTSPAKALIDPGQLEQVLTNLILNSIQSMPDGGDVVVEVSREHARPPEGYECREGEYYCLRVRDQGTGIKPDDVPRIFEPFFTTKDVGEGTGLGLSIAFGIIQEHGGWIEASSEVGHGSCFSVFLSLEVPCASRS